MDWQGYGAVACEACDDDLAHRGQQARGPSVTIVARVDRVRFERDNFSIVGAQVVSAPDDAPVRPRAWVSLLGNDLPRDGEVTVTGVFTPSKRGRGYDFKVTLVLQDLRHDAGLEAFLQRLPGIGAERAHVIVGRWPRDQLLSILANSPGDLVEVPGITYDRAVEIGEAYAEAEALRDSFEFLGEVGATPAIVAKAIKKWGADVRATVAPNLYTLMELDRVGFLTADNLARKNGYETEDPRRVDAAALYILQVAAESGHVWVDLQKVLR